MKHLSTRLSFSQAASGSISGVFTPFFSASLAFRGISPDQIGLLLSTALILRALGGPLSGIMADARNDRRFMMLVLYWITLAGFGALCVVNSPILIFITAVAAYVAYGAATPLLESVSVRLAERYGFDYGRVRIWASTLFVVMNVGGGIAIKFLSLGVIAPMLAVAAAVAVFSTLLLPKAPSNEHSTKLSQRFKATWAETRELLQAPVFLIFLAAASFEQASHAFYYGYGGLHWRSIGYSELLIGLIWPLGVLGEIALFSIAPKVQARLSPPKLIFLGGMICAIRWTILAFDPPLPVVIFAQFLHGGTFALAHLGAVFFVLKAVPQRLAATGQSLYFVGAQGVMMGIMTLAGGALYAAWDGKTYLTSAACGVIAMGFAVLLSRTWNGGRIIHGEAEETVDHI
ncbi:PPP family 3-phenylpropionic acid transporter [Rhizomicrobium palustre]|uniref:PPP family 3-phenylpropionic acid transporter n=1 Tax=Rhizomicrobium palustre TaxID=189966 RepID=A0A846MYW2_9PROT|nr:PPP family 3-phenylpropionic acid transporter [Rhizomicrobium palustre]